MDYCIECGSTKEPISNKKVCQECRLVCRCCGHNALEALQEYGDKCWRCVLIDEQFRDDVIESDWAEWQQQQQQQPDEEEQRIPMAQ